MDENSKLESINKYKRKLIHWYVVLMAFIILAFALIFTFLIPDREVSWYLYGGLCLLVFSYLIIRKNYSINLLVHIYFIAASLYSFYIILAFWENSIASFVWLLPIPLGAYVFFSRKYVIMYSIFVILIIILGYTVSNYIEFNFQKHKADDVRMTDTFLLISNVAILSLIIYYKDKIRKVEIYHHIEKKIQNEKKGNSGSEKELIFYEELFKKIENVMNEGQFYKDVNFNISKLSAELNVNSKYISQAIRQHEYPNFNNYLNIYRINHVKELLRENDLEKVTLQSIYTEAGFSNQSTFNRVFKQIEHITPSEYITHQLPT